MAQYASEVSLAINQPSGSVLIRFVDPIEKKLVAEVYVSVKTFKQMAILTRRLLKEYEAKEGPVALRPEEYEKLGVAPEDW